jgi:methionyl-tRNA formyltransferase
MHVQPSRCPRPFVFANSRHQPRGVLMLQSLLAAGFVPAAVIEEASDDAAEELAFQLELVERSPAYTELPTTEALCSRFGVAHHCVDDLNGDASAGLLRRHAPDLLLLGDAPLLRDSIFRIPPAGTINIHPGYLPDVRGVNAYIWAVTKSLPQGVTAHFVDSGIDTGRIVVRRAVETACFPTLTSIVLHLARTCGEVAVDVLEAFAAGRLTTLPPAAIKDRPYRQAPRSVIGEARALVEARFRHRPDTASALDMTSTRNEGSLA